MKTWPQRLPVLAVRSESMIRVVAGFERHNQDLVNVLILDGDLKEIIEEIWPLESLAGFERLRLSAVLEKQGALNHLLEWPLELQIFLDSKQTPLRSLRPLEHLGVCRVELSQDILKARPSSSQAREIFDLVCDLVMMGKPYLDLCFTQKEVAAWILSLKLLRHPKTLSSDEVLSQSLGAVSWPRGVRAKWERQGDQAGILIQTKVSSELEWKRLQESLQKTELGDGFWKN